MQYSLLGYVDCLDIWKGERVIRFPVQKTVMDTNKTTSAARTKQSGHYPEQQIGKLRSLRNVDPERRSLQYRLGWITGEVITQWWWWSGWWLTYVLYRTWGENASLLKSTGLWNMFRACLDLWPRQRAICSRWRAHRSPRSMHNVFWTSWTDGIRLTSSKKIRARGVLWDLLFLSFAPTKLWATRISAYFSELLVPSSFTNYSCCNHMAFRCWGDDKRANLASKLDLWSISRTSQIWPVPAVSYRKGRFGTIFVDKKCVKNGIKFSVCKGSAS